MAQHIGIVTCSAEGAARCYLAICREGAEIMGRHDHPEISMHNYPLSDYMQHITTGDWEGVAHLLLTSTGKVAAAGADFVICPSNTVHEAFDIICDRSPLPWLHIADVVVQEAAALSYRKIGILGTRSLMEGPVYASRLDAAGIQYAIPGEKARDRINHIILDELVLGRADEGARLYLGHIIDRLKEEGCDAVALASTVLPIAVTFETSSLPILDSARLLAIKALRAAVNHR